jgi:hypothetical protein
MRGRQNRILRLLMQTTGDGSGECSSAHVCDAPHGADHQPFRRVGIPDPRYVLPLVLAYATVPTCSDSKQRTARTMRWTQLLHITLKQYCWKLDCCVSAREVAMSVQVTI